MADLKQLSPSSESRLEKANVDSDNTRKVKLLSNYSSHMIYCLTKLDILMDNIILV